MGGKQMFLILPPSNFGQLTQQINPTAFKEIVGVIWLAAFLTSLDN